MTRKCNIVSLLDLEPFHDVTRPVTRESHFQTSIVLSPPKLSQVPTGKEGF
jgi:hypothetical protein